MRVLLRMTADQRRLLKQHLFPGDGKEAAAMAVCGRRAGPHGEILSVQEIIFIPHALCARSATRVTWPLQPALPMLHRAADQGLAVLKIHSHPQDVIQFSPWDDEADKSVFGALFTWSTVPAVHLSAFMLENGAIYARTVRRDGAGAPVDRVAVVGDAIEFHDVGHPLESLAACDLRTRQTFGDGTTRLLKRLEIGVVGASGTGSWVIEMLARLGVGKLVLVDPDKVEDKNLNRIVNATKADADAGRPKVEVMQEAIERMGFGTLVAPLAQDLRSPTVLRRLASCDVIFGCVDSPFARSLLNTLATHYLLPYFDVGVRLQADGRGGISAIYGGVHYLLPGGSSLYTRGVINAETVRADMMRRYYPDQYHQQSAEKYIRGAAVESPAVMPVNGVMASHVVMEFLARIHPFRCVDLECTRAQMLDLATGVWSSEEESTVDDLLAHWTGLGDRVPLLGDPTLSDD
jgi:molybdopterin/thiamine biosynthesis adenylyltransferase